MLFYKNFAALKYPTTILKALEVVILLICLSLMRHYVLSLGGNAFQVNSYYDRDFVGKMCIGGMILVTLPHLIGILAGNGQVTLTHLLQYGIGSILSLTTGGFALEVYAGSLTENEATAPGIAFGCLCLLQGLIYIIDCFLMFQLMRETV